MQYPGLHFFVGTHETVKGCLNTIYKHFLFTTINLHSKKKWVHCSNIFVHDTAAIHLQDTAAMIPCTWRMATEQLRRPARKTAIGVAAGEQDLGCRSPGRCCSGQVGRCGGGRRGRRRCRCREEEGADVEEEGAAALSRRIEAEEEGGGSSPCWVESSDRRLLSEP
jgi:hypothetical protein